VFWKLFNALAAIALAIVLACGCFAGYLFGTGKLSGQRLDQIAGVLRGEFDEPAEADAVGPVVAEAPAELPRAPSAAEVREVRKREHLAMLETERAARDLEAQRRLLNQTLQYVVLEQEKLAGDKVAFAQQRRNIQDVARDEGFQKELEIVSGMQARQAKEHILRTWKREPADAVRLLNAMDEGRVRRIFEQFKTAEELELQTDLLEQIRLQGMKGTAHASGMTGGAAAP